MLFIYLFITIHRLSDQWTEDQKRNEYVRALNQIEELGGQSTAVPTRKPAQLATQELTSKKVQKRIMKHKARKQRQRSCQALLKRERTETTTLVYLNQSLETKAFARAEPPSEELTRIFQTLVQRCTGVQKEDQRFDEWTVTNLETADISGSHVCWPPGPYTRLSRRSRNAGCSESGLIDSGIPIAFQRHED
jgi:hypothetical protein